MTDLAGTSPSICGWTRRLYCFGISREVWNHNLSRLAATFDHPAERHGIQSLLQELATRLIHTGSERMDGIEDVARESLMRRHT